jgi:hypothetical protein
MITVCIRYTIDIRKHTDFEQYARNWTEAIPRCGGELLGYFLPTRMAGANQHRVRADQLCQSVGVREISRGAHAG